MTGPCPWRIASLASLAVLGAACIQITRTSLTPTAPVSARLEAAGQGTVGARPIAPPSTSLDPESVGLSSERLGRLRAGMQGLVDDGALAGIVTLVARHGRIAAFDAFGSMDVATGKPMQKDTIFWIASMSKPITGVAMMILYEEGKWQLTDPVTKYIPEFAGLKVRNAAGNLEPMKRPMTMRELMNHSAGFAYGLAPNTPVDREYRDANVLDRSQPLEAMIGKLAKLPLAHQPGSAWQYSVAVDVQGYLVEKLSGQKFDEFLRTRIFEPLGMKDTGFSVAPEKADRVATIHRYDAQGKLVPMPPGDREATVQPALLSGGGGLLSTAEDYRRFCQMLLNGGELDGTRILAPSTVQLMRADHLPEGVRFTGAGGVSGAGMKFGLDFAVLEQPAMLGSYGKDSYFWGGAFGTWFWIDPTNDLLTIGMIAQLGGSGSANQPPGRRVPEIRRISSSLVYQSLVDPAR
jgi:CubicO group peptidase (beta-lactamase class C family)